MTDQSGIIQSAACVLNTLWLKLSAYQSQKVYVVGDLVSPNMMLNWESLAKVIKSGSTKSTLNNYPCF